MTKYCSITGGCMLMLLHIGRADPYVPGMIPG